MNILDVEIALDSGAMVTREKWVNQALIRTRERAVDGKLLSQYLGLPSSVLNDPEALYVIKSHTYLLSQARSSNASGVVYELTPYDISIDDKQADDWVILTTKL